MSKSRTVNRKNRDALVAVINRCLDGEMATFQFDDLVLDGGGFTENMAASYAKMLLENLNDQKAQWSKEDWSYLQRLILILESDWHIEYNTTWQWSFSQVAAVVAFLFALYAANWMGWAVTSLVLLIPLAAASMSLSLWNRRSRRNRAPKQPNLQFPFSSFADLLACRRSIPTFKRRKCPPGLERLTLRTPPMGGGRRSDLVSSAVLWVPFSPLVLLFQLFPAMTTGLHVVKK
jgi:hypothetical protein